MNNYSWIVMPVRNCQALTRQAVASCLAQTAGAAPPRVLAVDNASSDGVVQWLRTQRGVDTFYCPPPAGVTRTWNLALDHLFSQGAEHVLVVNNDVRLRPDTYKLLVEDGGGFVTCVGTSSGAQFPGGEPTGERRPHPDFSCFLIRRWVWEKVGRFDEEMAIYASDQDYHLRMYRAGVEAYCIDLPFYHYASGTLKQAGDEDRERILIQAAADRAAFQKKWGFAGGSPEYYKAFERSTE